MTGGAGLAVAALAGSRPAAAATRAEIDRDVRASIALVQADGWEAGTGPSVVFLDTGVQANAMATTLREPVYAITFSQQGLMAALALNGTRITRITPA